MALNQLFHCFQISDRESIHNSPLFSFCYMTIYAFGVFDLFSSFLLSHFLIWIVIICLVAHSQSPKSSKYYHIMTSHRTWVRLISVITVLKPFPGASLPFITRRAVMSPTNFHTPSLSGMLFPVTFLWMSRSSWSNSVLRGEMWLYVTTMSP